MDRIDYEKGRPEAWVCLCGNRPDSDGFFPCDEAGNEIEPVEGWTGLYLCNRCGRVIDQESLNVVGRAAVGPEAEPAPSRSRESAGS